MASSNIFKKCGEGTQTLPDTCGTRTPFIRPLTQRPSRWIRFKKISMNFNWRLITHSIIVVSAIHRYESAMGVHVTPILNPSPPPSHPTPSGSSLSVTGFEWCPVLPGSIKLGRIICSTDDNIHASVLFLKSPQPPCRRVKSLFLSVSLCFHHIQLTDLPSF